MRALGIRFVCVIAFALAAATSSFAQPPGESPPRWSGPPLPLAGALAEAREANPELRARAASVDVLRARPARERSLAPPMVEGQIWQWPVTTVNPADVNMYMVMLGQELPGRGKRDARAVVARREAETADAAVGARTLDVEADVKAAYAALYQARADLETTGDAKALLGQIVETARLAYAAGRGTQAGVIRAMAEQSRLDERIAALEAEAAMAAIRLNTLRGRPPGDPIGAIEPPPLPARLPAAADIERLALDGHPDLDVAAAGVAEASAAQEVARLERRPDFVVQGGYMLMPGEAGAVMARVGVTWPRAPWARERLTAIAAEADAGARAAREEAAAVEAVVRQMVHESLARVRAAVAQHDVLESTVRPQAAQLLDASRLAYAGTLASMTDVIEAQRLDLEARYAQAAARADVLRAWAALERAAGRDLPVNPRPEVP